VLANPWTATIEENIMDKFEEIGQKLDAELTRLRKFVENDLAPETEKRTATFLREVSEKLTEAAGWLEARRAGRTSPDEKKPAA
jgi:CHASE3 domain sensor protein